MTVNETVYQGPFWVVAFNLREAFETVKIGECDLVFIDKQAAIHARNTLNSQENLHPMGPHVRWSVYEVMAQYWGHAIDLELPE